MDRTVIVGDVHGCLEELQTLLRSCRYNPDCDRLVFVGDLLDRGPNPVGCLRLARGLGAEGVMGNHEEKHIRYHAHEQRKLRNPHYKNPVSSYDEDKLRQYRELRDDDFDFLRGWPPLLDLGKYGDRDYVVVHAGLEPAHTVENQNAGHVMRIRWVDKAGHYIPLEQGSLARPENAAGRWSERWNGSHDVIYGHAARSFARPVVDQASKAHCYGIDTGCVFGGRLTAMTLPSRLFVQVPARQAYVSATLDAA